MGCANERLRRLDLDAWCDAAASGMGYEVKSHVVGPFETCRANRASPDQGGTLDTAIVARTEDDTVIMIGEIWAACPGGGGVKIRIDAQAVAQQIVDALNAA